MWLKSDDRARKADGRGPAIATNNRPVVWGEQSTPAEWFPTAPTCVSLDVFCTQGILEIAAVHKNPDSPFI